MMIRFLTFQDNLYRLLQEDVDGSYIISFDQPTAPFFVDAFELQAYRRVETPHHFVVNYTKEVRSAAEQERMNLIQPLLENEECVCNKQLRRALAKQSAEKNGASQRRVLRLYYRFLARGTLLETKSRPPVNRPDFDYAIRKYYFSSRK